jgi:hypothetical protein
MAGATVIAVAYGIDVQSSNDPYIEVSEKALEGLLQAAVPGAFLVDTFPIREFFYIFIISTFCLSL